MDFVRCTECTIEKKMKMKNMLIRVKKDQNSIKIFENLDHIPSAVKVTSK